MQLHYDYLVVGAGLYGATFAYEMSKCGKSILLIDKRNHIAGNIYTFEKDNIQVHKYGAHIFHTNSKEIWDYVQQFAEFNRFTNSPIARYKNEVYNLPFNMNTFNKMWGVFTPDEAKEKIEEQKREWKIDEPKNLKEQAISLVGQDIYEKLVEGYTEKQWGKKATELPPFIIKRLPVRFSYDNNYFNDKYQGIPIGGYTQIVEKMLENVDVILNADFFEKKDYYLNIADKIIFTGMIDEFFDYCYGELEYRSLRFEEETLEINNFQGNAVVNYTEYEIPYTRIIEHKFFDLNENNRENNKTIITKEYPQSWEIGVEPYYPINDDKNNAIYQKYMELAQKEEKVIFGGRLGLYKYYDMHNIIEEAYKLAQKEKNKE